MNFELGKRGFLSNLKMYRPGYRYTDQGTCSDSILQTFGFQGADLFRYGVGKLDAVETGSRNEPAE